MASYDAFIKQLTNPRYLRRDLRIADIKGPRVPKVGVPRVSDAFRVTGADGGYVQREGFMAGSPDPDEVNKIKQYLISRKKDFLKERSLVDLGKELGYNFTKRKNNTYRNTDFEWKVNKIINENPELYKLTEQDRNRAYNKKFEKELKIAQFGDWGSLSKNQKHIIYNINYGLQSGRDPESFEKINVGPEYYQNKYKDALNEKFDKGQISSNKWEELSTQEKVNVTNKYLKTSELGERVLKIKIGDEIIDLPKGMKFSNFQYSINNVEKGFEKLLEWKKDPTPKRWVELFGRGESGRRFAENLRNYLLDKPIAEQAKNIFDSIDIKSKLNPDEIKKINDFTNLKQLKQLATGAGSEASSKFNKERIANQLNLIKDNEEVLNFIKNQDFGYKKRKEIANKVANIIDENASVAARRISNLAKAFSGDTEYVNLSTDDKNLLKGSKKISDVVEKNIFKDFGTPFKRQDYEREVSRQLKEDPTYMTRLGRRISQFLPEGFHRDEVKNFASSAKYNTGAYSLYTQGVLGNINSSLKRKVDAGVEKAERLLQDLDPFDPDYETKRNVIKDEYNKTAEDFTKKTNKNLQEGELPVRALKLSFEHPTETVPNFNDLPDKVKSNMLDTHKNFQYGFEVPLDLKTAPEADIFVRTPEGQALIKERYEKGHSRVLSEAAEPSTVPKLYETIRSGFQKYLPGLPVRAGAATADYFIQNYLFNMPAADAAVAASTWLVKNPQAADAMGKTINAALEGKATMEDAKNIIDNIVKNTNIEDIILPPALQRPKTDLPVVEQKEFVSKEQEEIPDYSEFKFKKGGRVGLKQGGEPTGMYYQEIPDVDPEIIIQKQIINEDDPVRVAALEHRLDMYRKKVAQEEKQRQEYKQAQKEQGIKYLEDFPSQTEYFKETAKQTLFRPLSGAYLGTKAAEGAVEGLEWMIGQPIVTGKALMGQGEHHWYHSQLPEKLGITSLAKKLEPENPTTGTLLAGDIAQLGGTFYGDPFLAARLGKKAIGGIKSLATPEVRSLAEETKSLLPYEETIDPTRRDLVKMMGVGAAAVALEPVLSKFSKVKTPARVAKAVAVPTSKVIDNMPEFFPYLSEFSLSKGKNVGDYMRSGMTEFKRELTIPLEIAGRKTDVKFKVIHDPAEGNVFVQYTNPLTGEEHAFDYFTGKSGKQLYGIDPEIPNAAELHTVEVESPGFYYKVPDKSDPYRKSYDYGDTATEADEVVVALDKWYKGLSKEEKAKFESKFQTHLAIDEELPAASWENQEENYPIISDFLYKKKND